MIRKLTILAILAVGCTEKNPAMRSAPNTDDIVRASSKDDDTNGKSGSIDETNGSTTINERKAFALGWRSIDQVNQTFGALTGVPVQSVRALFLELRTQLSTTTSLEEITPAKVGAMSKLAAGYCDSAMRTDSTRGALLGNATPGALIADPELLAEKLTNAFWGVDVRNQDFLQDSRAVIAQLTTELAQGKAAAAAPNVLVGVCAAVLASSPVAVF